MIHDPKSRTEKVKKDIQMADPENGKEIASNIPGTVSRIMVQEGDTIEAKQEIFIVEAMKMETSITASEGGTVAKILVGEGEQVKAGQLLLQIK
jgi:pyruvate carboxylase